MFSHNGITYSLDSFLVRAMGLPVVQASMSELMWLVDPDCDQERMVGSDTSIPILYTIDPVVGYVTIDGFHRVNKAAVIESLDYIPGKCIPSSWFHQESSLP